MPEGGKKYKKKRNVPMRRLEDHTATRDLLKEQIVP